MDIKSTLGEDTEVILNEQDLQDLAKGNVVTDNLTKGTRTEVLLDDIATEPFVEVHPATTRIILPNRVVLPVTIPREKISAAPINGRRDQFFFGDKGKVIVNPLVVIERLTP